MANAVWPGRAGEADIADRDIKVAREPPFCTTEGAVALIA